jgi:hypothetical protein
MRKPLEKLTILSQPGWFVWAYKPYRTQRGHMIWIKSRVIAGPFSSVKEANDAFPEACRKMLHQSKLTDEEVIAFIAHSD